MTIKATMICDSVTSAGKRLMTLQLRYPKFIHGEAKTHRLIKIGDKAYELLEEVGFMDDPMLSRNASSSRAIPVSRLIQDVLDDPVIPVKFGKNQPGMQSIEDFADDELINFECAETYLSRPENPEAGFRKITCREAWMHAMHDAVDAAELFSKAGVHKQHVNRLLEPFCHINVVVTATEWSNFFAQRCHPAAQPEMRDLASAMRDAMQRSTPVKLDKNQWHLPYVGLEDLVGQQLLSKSIVTEEEARYLYSEFPRVSMSGRVSNAMCKISTARCARVSYLTQDGKTPDIVDDTKLADRLIGARPMHASPAEHQGTPDPDDVDPQLHGNFVGWIQYRKTLIGECADDD